jgi:hypothetical protein
MLPIAAIAVAAAALYAWLAPAVVNGDGLGYLRAAWTGGVYPGHLGYVPLLRLFAGARAVDALGAARALSIGGAALAALSTGAAARRLGGRGEVAAAGLAASYSVIVSGSDVESYAPALACVCVALWALARAHAGGPRIGEGAIAGVAAAAAALLHVENLLLVAPLTVGLRGRARALALAICALTVGGAYAWAHATPLGASHGFAYPLRPWTPFVALYGAAKALVFSPYPYEASWPRVLACFAAGTAALAAVAQLARRGGAPLGRAVTLAWALPYTAVGVAFFASDHERWIFLLPLLWLSVARAGHPRARAGLVLAGALVAVNLALWLPRARDDSWRRRAAAAATHALKGDLIVSPGHGWDEYVGFYEGPSVTPYPLVYWAAALGGAGPLSQHLRERIARAPRVLLVRFADDGDPMGWKELARFGVTRETARALFAGRRTPLGDGVELLGD